MKRLALFSTFPPYRSGVSDYAESLARSLAAHWEVVSFYEDGRPVEGQTGKEPASRFRGGFGVNLFQISNNPGHLFCYPLLRRHGGVITLHDLSLFDMFSLKCRDDPVFFLRETIRHHGLAGLADLARAEHDSPHLAERLLSLPGKRERFPFLKGVLKLASGVIVHSHHARERVREIFARKPVLVAPLGMDPLGVRVSKAEARRRLGLEERGIGPESFLLVSFGFIQRHKRIGAVLSALRFLISENRDVHYVLVGPRDAEYPLGEEVALRRLEKRVIVVDDFPPLEEVDLWLRAADLAVNLRGPTYGASSATLSRIFCAGLPAAVSDVDSFAELPETCSVKVPHGEMEVARLAAVVRSLMDDPEELSRMARAALEYSKNHLYWKKVAERYTEFLSRFS